MRQHLPMLVVLLPLLAAPLCALARGSRWPAWLATAAAWATLVCAGLLLVAVREAGVVSYGVGGWPAPFGIELRVDAANALIALLVAALAAAVLPFAGRSIAHEIGSARAPLAHAALLLLVAGLLGICVTGDAFNVFVFLEISSLSTYALIAMGRNRRALTAAFRYLVMGTIGATFYLIGVGFLFAMTGTLNMADLAAQLPAVAGTRTVRTAFAFIITGMGLKLALFPLHLWLPNAYTYAPSAVTALVAATSTKVAVYLLLRFIYTVFGVEFSFSGAPLAAILLVLGVLGVLSASAVAIGQVDIKRMLAYSSVAQVGYMVLGLAMAGAAGVTAALLHMFNHGLMKGALFMALGAVALRMDGTRIEHMHGLARTMPWTFFAFVFGGLSLIGVPLTVGFVSKWYLILAALQQGWWPLVAVIVVGSLLALMYVGRVVEAGWFRDPADDTRREAPWSLLVPTWTLVLANLYFGIDTRLTVGMAELAAAQLTGSAP